MYCTKCGTKNSGKGLFCKHCGASLVDEALEEQDTNYRNKKDEAEKQDKVINKTVNKNKTKNKNKNVNKNDKNQGKKESRHNDSQREIVHKTSAFQKIMIAFMILIIIILTGGLIVAGLYIFQDKTVEVPDVVGSNVEQATLILENMDLRVKIKEKEVDDESQKDIVLKQNKEPGEFVAKNSRIILTIGVYEDKRLDNYVGLNVKQAESKLKRLRIDYEIKEIESNESNGIVISQTPTSGAKYDDNTKVVLKVSKKLEKEKTDTKVEKEPEEEIEENENH